MWDQVVRQTGNDIGQPAAMTHLVQATMVGPYGHLAMAMKIAHTETGGFPEILERRAAELA